MPSLIANGTKLNRKKMLPLGGHLGTAEVDTRKQRKRTSPVERVFQIQRKPSPLKMPSKIFRCIQPPKIPDNYGMSCNQYPLDVIIPVVN